MVTTRRQSKDFEPVELTVPHPSRNSKRKRSNNTANATQLPSQPLAKRPRKVKSTAKIGIAPEPAQPTPRLQPVAQPSTEKTPASSKSAERRARKAKARAKEMGATKSGRNRRGAKRSAPDSSDEGPPQPYPVTTPLDPYYDDDDDDADSRYALGPGRKVKKRMPAPTMARQTAELKFEEDGLEEVDKADVAMASKRTVQQDKGIVLLPSTTVNSTNMGAHNAINPSRTENSNQGPKKASFTSGRPSKSVMFTVAEAVEALSLYKDGTINGPAAIDPESRQPYAPLRTGETPSYPVKGTYHLGAIGRYGVDTPPTLPFALTVPLAEHSAPQTTHPASTGDLSRRGLGFNPSLPLRPGPPATRRPNNYCLPFGRYRGRRVDSVPLSYLQTLSESAEFHQDAKLQQAVRDLYPRGLYESEAESFRFESGGFKGRRLDEVPKSYVWGLLRDLRLEGRLGGWKGEAETGLEKALVMWEKRQLDLTRE